MIYFMGTYQEDTKGWLFFIDGFPFNHFPISEKTRNKENTKTHNPLFMHLNQAKWAKDSVDFTVKELLELMDDKTKLDIDSEIIIPGH